MLCVFFGYYEGTKAYHLMCVEIKRIIKSKNVIFSEGSKEIGRVLHPRKVKNVIVHEMYWKQLENKQEMKHSKFMKWNNCIN